MAVNDVKKKKQCRLIQRDAFQTMKDVDGTAAWNYLKQPKITIDMS